MDFYDKLITAIVCVVVTFICLFNTFCFADTTIQPELVENLAGSNGVFVDSDRFDCLVYSLSSCHTYIYTNNLATSRTIFFSSSVPAPGVAIGNSFQVAPGSSYTFSVDYDTYFYLSDVSSNVSNLYVNTLVDITNGLQLAVSNLVENVGISNIWETFEKSLPYVGVVVLASFGFYLIFHNIKELSKGREKMN